MSEKTIINFEEKEFKELEKIANSRGFKTVQELVDFSIEEFIKTALIEKQEFNVKVPKKLVNFAKSIRPDDLNQYFNDILTDGIAADLMTGDYGDENVLKQKFDMVTEFPFYEGH